MSTVESVDASSVSRRPEPMMKPPADPADVFAAMFQSVCLSVSQRADVMARRPGSVNATLSGHERTARTASRSGRQERLTGSKERSSPGTPGRVDRLGSMAREDENAPEQVSSTSQRRRDRGIQPARDRAAEIDRERWTGSDEPDLRDPEALEGADGLVQDNAMLRPDPNGAAVADPADGKGTAIASKGSTVSPETPGGHIEAAVAGSTPPPGGSADPLSRTLVTPSAPAASFPDQQPQTTGREAGSGQPQDAAQANGGGKAGSTAGRSSASSVDFQQAFEAAGRSRNQFATPQLRASSMPTGTNAGTRGINLSESQALGDLARVVRSAVGSRHATMTLRLEPPELGQLRIDVRMHDQTLTLRLEAETQAGHDALQGRLGQLRATLEQQGFQLNQVEVELRPPVPSAGQVHDGQGQQQPGSEWGGSASGGWADQGGAGAQGHGADVPRGTEGSIGVSTGNGPSEEGDGGVVRPAETGVDLVV